MQNYSVILTENKPDPHKIEAIVSLNRLNQLENLKTSGGFLRFQIDLMDNSKERATSKKKINVFLGSILAPLL